MKTILIVDASESDRRLMAGLLVKSGYEPIAAENMEASKGRGGETATGRSYRCGDEIRPWHSTGVNQLAED